MATPSGAPLGLYVHFPYCLRRCPYCDFAVAVKRRVPEEDYARAVLAELELRVAEWPPAPGRRLGSVYFGGGTPSLWAPERVAEVLEGIGRRLPLAADAEITLEANPERLPLGRLQGYRAAGVNRVSLGVQSFSTPTLRALGRAHDGPRARLAFTAVRRAGFKNVTMDLIYGVHGQELADVEADAQQAVALGPEHLSAYALTLERELLAEEVLLTRRVASGEVTLPADEVVVRMADAVAEACDRAGLRQYEISNFAQPGFESRHNRLYWCGEDCLALGCGAVGLIRTGQDTALRYTNLRKADSYLESLERGAAPEAEREPLGRRELATERLMTGLRLSEGVDLGPLLFDLGHTETGPVAELAQLAEQGLVRNEAGRIALTRAGRHLHSSVVSRLLR